jgi:hypothetical protein
MHSGLGTPKKLKRCIIIYWFCQFLLIVHRRILKNCKTPQQFNQGITKGLDMDGCHDEVIQEAKALLYNYTNPHTL